MDDTFITPEDFLSSDSFIHYCIGNDEEVLEYWDNWLENNPEKLKAANEAKRIFAVICGHEGNVEAEAAKFSLLLDKHIREEATPIKTDVVYKEPSNLFSFFKYWRAVAAFFLLGVSIFFFYTYNNKSDNIKQVAANIDKKVTDALPGRPKAKLIMGDGSVVDLDSLQSGNLKEKDGTEISKNKDVLVYTSEKNNDGEVLYNTLSTPRGGEYQLVLPDGSKVWLNAASSIRFPLKFTERSRVVYLTGEAYFEVTKNPHRPFQVQISNGMQIEVLGTQFNVMDYDDEAAVKTTLVEGKVTITKDGNLLHIKPSQQAVFSKSSHSLSVKEADVDKEIAWKNGLFNFDGASLEQVMLQLSRWYDIQVSYEKNIPPIEFEGEMDRTVNLGELLKGLEGFGIHFRLEENRRLLVMP